MAEISEDMDNNGLVQQARTDADALGRLYELYLTVFSDFVSIASLIKKLLKM